jgi:predicted GNAT family acetyltransferase
VLAFDIVNNEKAGVYEATADGREIAGLTYNVAGNDHLVLAATSVFPEFRGQGIASELIQRVLDDIRLQGKTITVRCPIVASFIERNPGYADLVR